MLPMYKRRNLLRLHLSTLTILTLAAAALLCVNMGARKTAVLIDTFGNEIQWERAYGWPIPCYTIERVMAAYSIDDGKLVQKFAVPMTTMAWKNAAIDAAFCAASLIVMAILVEWQIRRVRSKD